MSWMQKLYDTYEAGIKLHFSDGQNLMPISHTLQNAHINITIDGEGKFLRAEVLEKEQIVLPATEKSAGRTSGEAPHPLADKIQYVAKDYPQFGGKKKTFFESYKEQLEKWCNSEYAHKKCEAVFKYIKKGHVVEDLIKHKILLVDTNNKLRDIWLEEDGDMPLIFKVLPKKEKKTEQGDALVCWTVEIPGIPDNTTWNDHELQQSWIDFNSPDEEKSSLCYICGEEQPLAGSHPAKLRHTGDKAKIISSNDGLGFTFRGRFTDKNGEQAASISYDVTQKAHNALRWLISNQGYRNNDQVYVAWAISCEQLPSPLKNSWELFNDDSFALQEAEPEPKETQQELDYSVDLGDSFAQKFKKYLAGYGKLLEVNEQIVVMGIDSATPGRMSIIYYRELLASDFVDRLEKWHNEFAWHQRYTEKVEEKTGKKKSKKNKTIWPISTPSPKRIVDAAYGDILKSNETLYTSVVERILPCIIDGQPFPRDIVIAAVHKSCNRNNIEWWEWEQNLGTTCALYRGYYKRHPKPEKKRDYNMSLEKRNTSRDYLFGRLLAVAERIEETALRVAGENRPTNAARMMQRFADRPYSTWRILEPLLQPYMQRLQNLRAGFLVNRQKELDGIMDMFEPGSFTLDDPLKGEFLLGYHCQKQYWRATTKESNDTNEQENGENS